jgi:molecular chaperone GrpE
MTTRDPSESAPADGADTTTTPDDAPDSLQRERDELHDRLLRTKAEFDNYRKRTDRERRELFEAAAADVMHELLPIVDDLERALDASTDEGSADAYRRGVELIHRQVLDVLRKRGVETLEAVGQDFDPEWHEAVASEPAGDHRDGEVTAEIRRGYRIGSKLLRPAMVKVAKA